MIETSCYLCKSDRRATVAEQTFVDPYLSLIDERLNERPRAIVVCRDCGFAYHNPTLTPDEIRTLYLRYRDTGFRGESGDAYFDRITSLPLEQSFNWQKVQKLNPLLEKYLPAKPVRSVYDIGAGGGVFLKTFLDHAIGRWEACGVEPTVSYAELAARRLGIPVLGTMYRAALFERKFDFITIIKVLEHAPDPIGLMADMLTDLEQAGLVYVEVPSVREVGSLPENHDQLTYTHLNFYSAQTLRYILDRAGFELLSLDEVPNPGGDWDLIALLRKRQGSEANWRFPLQDYREVVALRQTALGQVAQ